MDNDSLEGLWPRLQKLGYHLDGDGRITKGKGLEPGSPWIFMNYSRTVGCVAWRHVLYPRFHFIPSPCHACFKVVVRPRTLRELHQLLEVGKKLGRRSKCGIEVRDFVHGLYGAYFYCIGIEEALERHAEVRAAVDAEISPAIPVIIRRGCSVYEMEMGPSDAWVFLPGQLETEAALREAIAPNLLDFELVPYQQPPVIQGYIQKRWVQWAYQNGDATYQDFIGTEPLYPPVVTYHNSPEAVQRVQSSLLANRGGSSHGR